jgi:nitroreductase
MIEDLVKKARCYRKYDESKDIDYKLLENIINNLRFTSSARNAQPIKYLISTNRNTNEKIFETLKWAGYLKDWYGPKKGQRPSAYIVILRDKDISKEDFSLIDTGIALQTIILSLAEKGLASCTIAAIDKEQLRKNLSIDNDSLEILLVLSIGVPKENVIITDMKNGDIKYYRDENENHYVPKRSLEEIVYKSFK